MSNGDESMSPAEFAKLMGAYPEPVGNPLPAYGGYMDNSPANFAWVQNNDYFGAESFKAEKLHPGLYRYKGKIKMRKGWTECQECDNLVKMNDINFAYLEGYGNATVCDACVDKYQGFKRMENYMRENWTSWKDWGEKKDYSKKFVPVKKRDKWGEGEIYRLKHDGIITNVLYAFNAETFEAEGKCQHRETGKYTNHNWMGGPVKENSLLNDYETVYGQFGIYCDNCGQEAYVSFDMPTKKFIEMCQTPYTSQFKDFDLRGAEYTGGLDDGEDYINTDGGFVFGQFNFIQETHNGTREHANTAHFSIPIGEFLRLNNKYLEIERNVYGADTDLTPTNHMNNSIGQVVPITNPMELPTNLIETEAGGGPEGQITPDTFEATPKWECDECGDMHDDENDAESCCVIDCDHSDSEMTSWGGAYRGSEFWMTCNNCGADGHGTFDRINWEHGDDKTLEHEQTAETFEADFEHDAMCGHPNEVDCMECGKVLCWDCTGVEEFDETWTDEHGTFTNKLELCRKCCDHKEKYGAETFEAKQDFDSWKTGVIRMAIDNGCFTDDYAQFVAKEIGHDSKRFNAPYGGAGSLMDIGKATPLADFTDEELTTSSAIHGDFDQASLNYSGHQNIEVKAEMDIVADGMAVVSNVRDEMVGVVEVIDDEDDDEMVEISIQDENLHEIGSFTLDDGMILDDEDNYLAETKTPSLVALGIGAVAVIIAFPYLKDGVNKVFGADNEVQEVLENDPELIENPDTGDLDPAQYEELVVESTGYALDVIPMGLDGSFMGSRFSALPTERYVDYNDPGIGAHTDIALDRDEIYREPEMSMVQAAEGDTVIKETQAPGQSPYFQMGEEPADMNYRVIKETHPISLDPAVKPFIPQSMTGYTGNKNTPPSVYNKMFNIGVLGQTPAFVVGDTDMGANHFGSRDAKPDMLGLGGSVGGPLSDQVNLSYTDGTTSMSLAQWAIENTVSQSSDTEAVVIDRSSGAMKRIRRV